MKAAKAIPLDGVASGIWKFNLQLDDVINLACLLRNADANRNYIAMSVRSCGEHPKTGKKQNGIEFSYLHNCHSEAEYSKWFHIMERKLDKLSGKRLCGWDICSDTVSIV